jgi:hypothetical protein
MAAINGKFFSGLGGMFDISRKSAPCCHDQALTPTQSTAASVAPDAGLPPRQPDLFGWAIAKLYLSRLSMTAKPGYDGDHFFVSDPGELP